MKYTLEECAGYWSKMAQLELGSVPAIRGRELSKLTSQSLLTPPVVGLGREHEDRSDGRNRLCLPDFPVDKGITSSTKEMLHYGQGVSNPILNPTYPAVSYTFCYPKLHISHITRAIKKSTSKAICALNTASTTSAATRIVSQRCHAPTFPRRSNYIHCLKTKSSFLLQAQHTAHSYVFLIQQTPQRRPVYSQPSAPNANK